MDNPEINSTMHLIGPESTLREVTGLLEQNRAGIVLVVNKKQVLQGVITDSDLRKAIIAGCNPETPAREFMNRSHHSLPEDVSNNVAMQYMELHSISELPILSKDKKVIKVLHYDSLTRNTLKNAAMIMAGGRGSRLMPLTKETPKPMLEVGGKPLLERTIETLHRSGIRKIYISLLYKADLIKDFLKTIDLPDLELVPIIEKEALGTGGSLTLIEDDLQAPLMVLNADVITNLDLREMISFHNAQNASLTVGVTTYQLQIPFGVLQLKDFQVLAVNEKPMYEFPIVAGIYVVSPEIIKVMNPGQHQDLPALIPHIIKKNMRIAAFPIWEKWMDIGSHEQYELAQSAID